MVKRQAANRSYMWSSSRLTDFKCGKCGHLRRRCEGCDKIICFCDKRNGHIVGTDMYICFDARDLNKDDKTPLEG